MTEPIIRIEYAVNTPGLGGNFDTENTTVTYAGLACDENGVAVRVIDVIGSAQAVQSIISSLEEKAQKWITCVRELKGTK